jgi:chromosomal replication initiator protein
MEMQAYAEVKYDRVVQRLISSYGPLASSFNLRARFKRRPIVFYRQEAAWLMRHAYKKWSLPMIGKALGDRHHTTIISAIAAVERRRAKDEKLRIRLDAMLHDLTG